MTNEQPEDNCRVASRAISVFHRLEVLIDLLEDELSDLEEFMRDHKAHQE